jgi:transcriptional regulator with XRE-family HTH domain
MRLRIVRFDLGLSVDQAAELCDVAPATWTKWEHGTQPRTLVRVIERISAATGIDREWLMWGGALSPSTKWYSRPLGTAA